jgi:hypothetical protein
MLSKLEEVLVLQLRIDTSQKTTIEATRRGIEEHDKHDQVEQEGVLAPWVEVGFLGRDGVLSFPVHFIAV